jgi:hypothetical protein
VHFFSKIRWSVGDRLKSTGTPITSISAKIGTSGSSCVTYAWKRFFLLSYGNLIKALNDENNLKYIEEENKEINETKIKLGRQFLQIILKKYTNLEKLEVHPILHVKEIWRDLMEKGFVSFLMAIVR